MLMLSESTADLNCCVTLINRQVVVDNLEALCHFIVKFKETYRWLDLSTADVEQFVQEVLQLARMCQLDCQHLHCD